MMKSFSHNTARRYIAAYWVAAATGINPLECRSTYTATSNNMKLVHWPLMGGCYIWYSEEGLGRAPLGCTKCNSPPINCQLPITVLLYTGWLLCGLNVPVKRLTVCSSLCSYSNALVHACSELLFDALDE